MNAEQGKVAQGKVVQGKVVQGNAGKARRPIHPYLVLLVAAVAPGSGHWAAGNVNRGVMFAWFMFVLGMVSWHLMPPGSSPVARLAGGLLIYGIQILDAYKLARIRWVEFQHGQPTP